MERKKAIVIGLDGATFKLIDSFSESELPFLKKLIRTGTRATLKSTYPPVTAPAWTTMYTGVNPGRHGIFDFQKLDGRGGRTLVTAADNSYPFFWEALQGDSLLVDMPMTYPPKKTRGVLITGNPTPFGSDYTWPREIRKTIEEKGYLIEFRQIFDPKKHTIRDDGPQLILKALESKFDALPALLDRDFDLIFFVVAEIDMMCHIRWEEPENAFVREAYKRTDTLLQKHFGRFLGERPVFVVSDHGFGGNRCTFSLNGWLKAKGFLSYRSMVANSYDLREERRKETVFTNRDFLYSLSERLHLDDVLIKKTLGRLKLKELAKKVVPQSLKKSIPRAEVVPDWAKSSAYAFSYDSMGLNINLKGREKEGSVETGEYERVRTDLVEKLKNEVNPYTGRPVFNAVLRREEAYEGENVAFAPDVVFLPDEEVGISLCAGGEDIFSKATGSFHTMDGIFAASGPGISAGKDLGEAAMADIAPTLLHYYEEPVPEYMEGRVLDVMSERRSVKYACKEIGDRRAEQFALNDSETEEIAARLKGLGYL